MMKKTHIKFVDVSETIHEDFWPKPASKNIPQWYKETPSYFNESKYPDLHLNPDQGSHATIKKCLPLFDSFSAGYHLFLHADIIVKWLGDHHYFSWRSGNPIGFQGASQNKKYPNQENRKSDYPKFMNSWSIQTPRGYSSLFITPMHHDLPFKIFEGIVDTDFYFSPVELPFIFKETEWEGVIEAGTPIAQVIPFQRESWTSSIVDFQKSKKRIDMSTQRITSSFINAYRKTFWNKKIYD